jgi:carbamoyltransferase
MRILAFNIAHDSSVCAINNGKIEFFSKEERLSRIKRDKHPFKSLDLYRSLNYGKVDHVLYTVPSDIEPDIEITYSHYIKKYFGIKLENFSSSLHHKCHASLAYFNSGFDDALVFVIDRNGSIFFKDKRPVAREAESVFLCNSKDLLVPIYKSFWSYEEYKYQIPSIKKKIEEAHPNCDISVHNFLSVVKVYEAATTLIGQDILENGKTMGLSSYGTCSKKFLFSKNLPISDYFKEKNSEVYFKNLENLVIDNVNEENFQIYADTAKQVQIETQDVVLDLIRKYVDITGVKNVCIVGGYGLNVVANNWYVKNLPYVNFYFEPVADDTGVPIGSAMLKYNSLTGQKPEALVDNFYHYYDSTEKITLGKKSSLDEICNLLIDQKSIAIFNGNPEAGPRALGHRSILFDPRNKNGKKLVNQIKKREWYRPFAGIILESEFKNYFETLGIKKSSSMTINFSCKERTKKIVPSIIHVDGSCRVQTVSEGFIFELLNQFNNRTGCPMLLNTSFNMAGEPLVQTKKDAIETLKNSSLDGVFFVDEQRLVLKSDIT